MSMNSPHESVKDIVSSVWKNNRPLAIAALVMLVVLGFILYKKSQASIVAPTDVTPSTNGLPGNTYNNSYVTITKTVTGQPGTVTAPGPIPAPAPGTVGIAGKDYGLIPFSFFPTGRFPTIAGSSTTNVKTFTYQGVKYAIRPAGQGKVYGVNPQGQSILLYEPISFYPGGTNYGK